MISEEMKKFHPINYLAHLPIPNFNDSFIIQNEFIRISEGKKMKVLDESRYKVLGPRKNQINIFSKWKKCIENVQIRLGEEENILINLQIQQKWAKKFWKIHQNQIKQQEIFMKKKVSNSRQRKNDVNRKRKSEQTGKKNELDQFENEWWSIIKKNNQTQLALEIAEQKVSQLKKECKRRKII